MRGWRTRTNATASRPLSATLSGVGTSLQPPTSRRWDRRPCGASESPPATNGLRASGADGDWVFGIHTRERPCPWRPLDKRQDHSEHEGRLHHSLVRGRAPHICLMFMSSGPPGLSLGRLHSDGLGCPQRRLFVLIYICTYRDTIYPIYLS